MRWLVLWSLLASACTDSAYCTVALWRLHLTNTMTDELPDAPIDAGYDGSLYTLVNTYQGVMLFGSNLYVYTPTLVRVPPDGRAAFVVDADPYNVYSGIAVDVRTAEDGDVLVTWADSNAIALAAFDAGLVPRWSSEMPALPFDERGPAFAIDAASGQVAVTTTGRDQVPFVAVLGADGVERWRRPSFAYRGDRNMLRIADNGDVLHVATGEVGSRRRRHASSDGSTVQDDLLESRPIRMFRDGSFFAAGQVTNSPDLARAARYGADGVRIWEQQLGEVLVTTAAVSTTGDLLVATTHAGTQELYVLDGGTGEVRSEVTFCGGRLIGADAAGYSTVKPVGASLELARFALP